MTVENEIGRLKQLQVKEQLTAEEQAEFKKLYEKILINVTCGRLKLEDVSEIYGMVEEAMQIISRKKNDGGAGGGFRP